MHEFARLKQIIWYRGFADVLTYLQEDKKKNENHLFVINQFPIVTHADPNLPRSQYFTAVLIRKKQKNFKFNV